MDRWVNVWFRGWLSWLACDLDSAAMRLLMNVGLIGSKRPNQCNGRIALIHSKKTDIRLLPVKYLPTVDVASTTRAQLTPSDHEFPVSEVITQFVGEKTSIGTPANMSIIEGIVWYIDMKGEEALLNDINLNYIMGSGASECCVANVTTQSVDL